MSHEPLTTEKANPCMKCGSVQCSFCSDDVASAVELTLQEIERYRDTAELLNKSTTIGGYNRCLNIIRKNFSGVLEK